MLRESLFHNKKYLLWSSEQLNKAGNIDNIDGVNDSSCALEPRWTAQGPINTFWNTVNYKTMIFFRFIWLICRSHSYCRAQIGYCMHLSLVLAREFSLTLAHLRALKFVSNFLTKSNTFFTRGSIYPVLQIINMVLFLGLCITAALHGAYAFYNHCFPTNTMDSPAARNKTCMYISQPIMVKEYFSSTTHRSPTAKKPLLMSRILQAHGQH